MRYNLVLAGEIVPVFHALHVEEYIALLVYMPSFHEIAVVSGGLALAGGSLCLGGRVLQTGHQRQKHEIVPPGAFICSI